MLVIYDGHIDGRTAKVGQTSDPSQGDFIIYRYTFEFDLFVKFNL